MDIGGANSHTGSSESLGEVHSRPDSDLYGRGSVLKVLERSSG